MKHSSFFRPSTRIIFSALLLILPVLGLFVHLAVEQPSAVAQDTQEEILHLPETASRVYAGEDTGNRQALISLSKHTETYPKNSTGYTTSLASYSRLSGEDNPDHSAALSFTNPLLAIHTGTSRYNVDLQLPLLIILGVLLIAFPVAWGIGRFYLDNRLNRLTQTVRKLAEGDLSARTGLTASHREIESLARSIDEMAGSLQRREKAIEQNEASFQRMAENAQDILFRFIYLPEPHFEYVSPAAQPITGYSPEEFYADPNLALNRIDPQDHNRSDEALQDKCAPTLPITLRFIRKDGEVIWVELRVAHHHDAQGNPTMIEGIARDVTETKHSEQLLKRLLDELKALHGVALAGTESTTTDELIARATKIIGESLYPENFGIILYHPSTDELVPHASFRCRDGSRMLTLHLGEGIVGKAAQTRQPICIGDVQEYAGYIAGDPEIRAEVSVPLIVDGQLLGVIDAESTHRNAFTKPDEHLLVALASELATAIEKTRLLEAERRRRKEAETLSESGAALNSSLDLHQVLETILGSLGRVVPYTSTTLMLLNEDHLEISAGRGLKLQNLVGVPIDPQANQALQSLVASAQPSVIADTLADPNWHEHACTQGARSWMGIPLLAKGRVIGVLNVNHNDPGVYTTESAQMALAYANQAAVAIENARLFETERNRSHQLAVIASVSSALRVAQSRDAMLPIILSQVIDLFEAQGASLAMRDQTTGDMVIEHAQGIWAQYTGLRIPTGRGISSKIATSGKPYLNNEAASDATAFRPEYLEGANALLGVPLIVQAQVIGVLFMGRQAPIEESEIRLTRIQDPQLDQRRAGQHDHAVKESDIVHHPDGIGGHRPQTLKNPGLELRGYRKTHAGDRADEAVRKHFLPVETRIAVHHAGQQRVSRSPNETGAAAG